MACKVLLRFSLRQQSFLTHTPETHGRVIYDLIRVFHGLVRHAELFSSTWDSRNMGRSTAARCGTTVLSFPVQFGRKSVVIARDSTGNCPPSL